MYQGLIIKAVVVNVITNFCFGKPAFNRRSFIGEVFETRAISWKY